MVPEYEKFSDEELLQVASDRESLTDEAVIALDAEVHNRHLTRADLARHESFIKRSAKREKKRRLRKAFGSSRDKESWVDGFVTLFWSLLAISLIWMAYIVLPQPYHFSPDWEKAAGYVMFDSVFIAVASSFWWRRVAFWVVLLISSGLHALLLHLWIIRVGSLDHGDGRSAVLLGLVLFAAVGVVGLVLDRKIHGEEAARR